MVPVTFDAGTEYRLNAGEVLNVTRDTTVTATRLIRIDGTILLAQGVNLKLQSDQVFIAGGGIHPAPVQARRRSSGVQPALAQEPITEADYSLTIDGNSYVEVDSAIEAVASQSVQLFGQAIIIQAPITAGDGNPGTELVSAGRPGGSIEIKSTSSRSGAFVLHGNLTAGKGGPGYTDTAGHDDQGRLSCVGGPGGEGGIVHVEASAPGVGQPALDGETLRLDGAVLTPGRGGRGGDAGPASARSGQGPEQPGQSFIGTSGIGGPGGTASVFAGEVQGTSLAAGGDGGDVIGAAGQGGEAAPGGDFRALLGRPGLPETLADDTPVQHNQKVVVLANSGRGGDAIELPEPGGDGGQVHIEGYSPDQVAYDADVFVTLEANVSKGGDGFNGCAHGNVAGMDGGDGGSYSETFTSEAINPGPGCFDGGAGGDGCPFGHGGSGMLSNPVFHLGQNGPDGKPCSSCGGTTEYLVYGDTGGFLGIATVLADNSIVPLAGALIQTAASNQRMDARALSATQTRIVAVNAPTTSLAVADFNPQTGALTGVGSPLTVGTGSFDCALTPNGHFCFIPRSVVAANTVDCYDVTQSPPVLVDSLPLPNTPSDVAADDGDVYITSSTGVHHGHIDATGHFTAAADTAGAQSCTAPLLLPGGNFFYAAQTLTIVGGVPTGGGILSFARNPTTGVLTPLGATASQPDCRQLAADHTGQALFSYELESGGGATLRLWHVNTTTGDLTPDASVAAGNLPFALAASPDQDRVFLSDVSTTFAASNRLDVGAPIELTPSSLPSVTSLAVPGRL